MILFSLDVRRRICSKDRAWMDYVTLKTDISLMKDNEQNEEIRTKLERVQNILEDVVELKKEEMKEEIDKFEKEFTKEVLENDEFYSMRIEA